LKVESCLLKVERLSSASRGGKRGGEDFVNGDVAEDFGGRGGVEDGETYARAAVRELEEETGLRVREDDLVGPIAHRHVTHGFSDEILVQDEQFFAVDVARFEPDPAGFTPAETRTLLGFGWLDADDLRTDARGALSLTPADIDAFLAADADTFIEYGDLESSTVPV